MMGPMIDTATSSLSPLDILHYSPPAELRTVTDIGSPLGILADVPGAITLAKQTALGPLYFDPWLFETLFVIESYRGVESGWDGDMATAPSNTALKGAEMLSAFLALSDADRRPDLCVDSMGRPTFATNIDDFYIHLTVDAAGKLTWYAVENGVERFADDVEFNGREVPNELANLFQITAV
jgi:hypothetical protein